VFQRLLEQNQRQLETAAAVLSADFAFREAIATQDQPTVRSVIRNHGQRIHAQVMMVAGADGALIATTQRARAAGDPFPFPDLLAAAEASGRSAGFRQMRNGQVYQVVLVPIMAPRRIAWVAMAFHVDDRWARDMAGVTGLGVHMVRTARDGPALLSSSAAAPRARLEGRRICMHCAASAQCVPLDGACRPCCSCRSPRSRRRSNSCRRVCWG
jgi:hypothetical protein